MNDDYRARVRAATEGYLQRQREIAAKAAEPKPPKQPPKERHQTPERNVLTAVAKRAAELGIRLFRNQVGAYQLRDGRWVRSGLAVGSPDFIGWIPVIVTPSMVGRTIAVFVGLEAKRSDGQLQESQQKFLRHLEADGAIQGVCRSADDASDALRLWMGPK